MNTVDKVTETLLNGPIRICRKCKFYRKDGSSSFTEYHCTYYVTKELNVVTGRPMEKGQVYTCSNMRSLGTQCGPEGKCWEPKPPLTLKQLFLRLFFIMGPFTVGVGLWLMNGCGR